MIELIARGISIGFSSASLPGPFQAYTINNSLTTGWRKSLILVFVPIFTDIPLIILVVFLLGSIPVAAIRILEIVGSGVLLWIAWGAWQQWRAGANLESAPDSAVVGRSQRQILQRGVMMGLLSPGPYLFWGTVNGPILINALHQSILHGAAFLVSFYATFGVLIGLTVLIADRLGTLDPRLRRGLILLTIVILVVFAFSLIFQAIAA